MATTFNLLIRCFSLISHHKQNYNLACTCHTKHVTSLWKHETQILKSWIKVHLDYLYMTKYLLSTEGRIFSEPGCSNPENIDGVMWIMTIRLFLHVLICGDWWTQQLFVLAVNKSSLFSTGKPLIFELRAHWKLFSIPDVTTSCSLKLTRLY